MLPDRVSNPGPLTYESGALPIALRGPNTYFKLSATCKEWVSELWFNVPPTTWSYRDGTSV